MWSDCSNTIRLQQYNQTAAIQSDCSNTIRLQQCDQTAAMWSDCSNTIRLQQCDPHIAAAQWWNCRPCCRCLSGSQCSTFLSRRSWTTDALPSQPPWHLRNQYSWHNSLGMVFFPVQKCCAVFPQYCCIPCAGTAVLAQDLAVYNTTCQDISHSTKAITGPMATLVPWPVEADSDVAIEISVGFTFSVCLNDSSHSFTQDCVCSVYHHINNPVLFLLI